VVSENAAQQSSNCARIKQHIHSYYTYDTFGNMIEDKNKSITQIKYNHLNLPTRIEYQGGDYISYLYSADGTKLQKHVNQNGQNPKTVAYYDASTQHSTGGGQYSTPANLNNLGPVALI